MLIFIIIALVIAIIGVVFALQNPITISVTLLFWSFHGSLALVLLGTLAVGVLISLLASPPSTKKHIQISWPGWRRPRKINLAQG